MYVRIDGISSNSNSEPQNKYTREVKREKKRNEKNANLMLIFANSHMDSNHDETFHKNAKVITRNGDTACTIYNMLLAMNGSAAI